MANGVYAAKLVTITYGEISVTGLAAGSFVKWDLNKPTIAWSPDADGGGCFTQEGDLSGYIEFTLHQSSPSSSDLQSKALDQRQPGGGDGPESCVVRDLSGTLLVEGVGMLEKQAAGERAVEATNQTWKVIVKQLDQSGGGVT